MSLSFPYFHQVSRLQTPQPGSAYQCLSGSAGQHKAGDQPARIPQVVELGRDNGMRGQEDGSVSVTNKDACVVVSPWVLKESKGREEN
jgi:hypothetical protein